MRVTTAVRPPPPLDPNIALSSAHRQELLAAFSKLSRADLEKRKQPNGLPHREYYGVSAGTVGGRAATLYVPEHGTSSDHASRFYVQLAGAGKSAPTTYGPFRLELSQGQTVPPDIAAKAQQIVEEQIGDVLGDAKDELRGDLTFKPGKDGTVLVSGKVFRDDLWGGASTWKFTATVDVKKGVLSDVQTS